MSYTSFKLTEKNASSSQITFDAVSPSQTIEINVENTGEFSGDEVVMAFFMPKDGTVPSSEPASKLKRQLFDFNRVTVDAGKSTTVSFQVAASTLQLVDEKGNGVLYPGLYDLSFTNGVAETVSVTVQLTTPNGQPQIVDVFSPSPQH